MSPQGEVSVDQVGADLDDVEIVGSDEDVAIIDRDDVSNYNPENILPEPPEIITKIRHWLGPTDYNHESGEFRKHLAAHMPGTGKWLFAKPNYQEWHNGQDNGLLWIKGIPGSGKSVFAATLIDELSREGHPVLFFFFRQIIEANHKPVNLLRDWLDQILDYSPPLQAELKAFVDEKSSKRGYSIDKLNFDDLWKYLKMALVSMPRVYLVADALDEMDKGNNKFLQALARLGSWKPSAVKMIITSRPINTIEEPLRGIPMLQVRLEEKLVDVDIAAYVQRGIDSSAIPVEDRQLITEAVPGRANGLFLYAKLAMDAFLEPDANIRQVLGSLPADLNDMYTGLLHEHARRSGVARDVQMLILSWVTHATRPLRLIELAEFVRTSHVGEGHLDLGTAKDLVRAACGPLLEILSDETISVIHHSLTEFLNGSTRLGQDRATSGMDGKSSGLFPVLTPGATHERLAVSCLRYLLAGCLGGMKFEKTMIDDQLFKSRKGIRHDVARLNHPSLTYAAENWFVHASKATNDGSNLSSVLSSSLDEFLQQGPRLDAWLDISWHPEPTKDVTPCHVVARYGLTSYLDHFVRRYPGKDVIDARDAYERTPLFLAASNGYAGVVKVLIGAGADPDAEENAGLKPLHQAAKANYVEVARALVEAGVSPLTKKTKEYPGRWCGNSPSTVGDTPLMYACEAGHLEVLEVFLPSLVDSKYTCDAGKLDVLAAFMPHSSYYDYGDFLDQVASLPDLEGNSAYYQALGWASVCGRSKLVKRLLQHPGIELDRDTYGKRAFSNACRNADIQSMEAILEAGVIPTPEALDHFLLGCSSAWSYAQRTYQPHETGIDDIKRGLDLFLGAGVPIEECNPHFAVANPLLLRLLLQAGADANFESEDGATLLHKSLKGEAGWEVVVLLVEEGGADVNRQTQREGKSPLQAQIETPECHVENCIRFIERYHPDCSLTDKEGRGPLTSLVTKRGAFVGGTVTELAEKLVAAGASPNQQDHAGKTPIHYAEKMEIVALLVKLGADINARDHSGTTRLMDHLRKNLIIREIDEMIALGARLDLRDFRGRTLLHHILPGYSSKDKRNHLIALGMDPLVTDYSGNTLLHELLTSCQTIGGFHGEKEFLTAFTELKDLGVNPNTPNNSGQTVLHMLIEKGASRNILSHALECCDLECVDYKGLRPIHLAAKKSGGSVFSLIAAGAYAFPTSYQGETPLHLAAESQDSNTVGILLDILETGKYGDPSNIIDARDKSGRTALYYACKAGRPETVALLLGAGATLKAAKLREIMDALLRFDAYQRPYIRLPHEYELDRAARGWPMGRESIAKLAENETVRLEEIVDMLLAKGLSFEEPKPSLLLEEAINQGLENRLDYNVRCMRKLLPRTSNLPIEGTSRPSFRGPGGLFSLTNPFTSRRVDLRDQSSWIALYDTKFLGSIAGKRDPQMELMMELLRERQFDLVEALFKDDSFDPLLKASKGTTPLHVLVSRGYWRIVNKVVTVDKLPSVESLESLIRTACERSLPNMEVLQILVQRLQACLSAHRIATESMDSGSMADKFAVSPLFAVVQGWWQVRQALPFLLSLPPDLRPDLEVKDPSGDTPLVKSLLDSGGIFRKEAARLLIEAGANVNATYRGSQTCLSLAGSDLELVRLLLKHGATVTGDALFGAIESRNEELMGLFLSSGADPNMRQHAASSSRELRSLEDEHFPLYRAATKSSGEIVRQLLDYGADPFAKYENFPPRITRRFSYMDGDGSAAAEEAHKVYKQLTVLHEIIRDDGLIGPFFEALPDLDLEHRNEDGETLLLAACYSPGAFVRMVNVHGEDKPLGEILLERGAITHAVDNINRNALHLLMLSLQNDSWWNEVLPLSRRCFELLLGQTPADHMSQKADGVVIHQHPGMGTRNTPLHLALQNAVAQRFARVGFEEEGRGLKIFEDDSEAIIDLLLEAGSDLLASNGEGDTALHMLARGMEQRPISRRLFEKFLGLGLDINGPNKAGETPLFIFVKSPPIGGSDVLEYQGADYEAAWRVFVDKGADFQARDHEGKSLLHAVACSKLEPGAAGSRWDFEVELRNQQRVGRFKRLMGMGLDPFALDNKMRSSLDVAVACGDSGILQLFKEDGSQVQERWNASVLSYVSFDE